MENDQAAPAPKKRGRKPLGGASAPSRAARESARRANHSRIEKARRLKINGALEALRELVPSDPATNDTRVPGGSSNADDEDVDGECSTYPVECSICSVLVLMRRFSHGARASELKFLGR